MKLKYLFILMLVVLLFVLLCTLPHVVKMQYGSQHREVKPSHSPATRASNPADICENCQNVIQQVLDIYSQAWTKNKDNHRQLQSKLSFKCNGFNDGIITQANTPLMSVLVYDGDKATVNVTEEMFNTFAKNHPFSNRRLDTCAVVGNGGILSNSGCGEAIDSAQFVIRCNMPPLEGNFSKDVGTKSDIVTANPTIFVKKYGSFLKLRRPFVDHARFYGDAMLLTPTFSFRAYTGLILRAFYTIQDSELPIQPVSMNPVYLKNLNEFWKTHGLNPKIFRLSTGLMMTSLAVEICDNVHLYGFWPFDQHPHTKQPLNHHYYDKILPGGFHSMSDEFKLLLKLHREGVLKLHLGQCPPPRRWRFFS
ncbi:alpha-2,8-sialyltransferase 8F-like [Eucyclogobius newberryi]|uniref:alpha-2,8-sialyltransferase 8F-like n=1 Tax=Eucyclogobius newberryi TaxID=166745 RepID=UPI003B5BFDA5